MPTYMFQSETDPSRYIERVLPMSQAPSVGERITVEGQNYRRVFEPALTGQAPQGVRPFKAYKTRVLPKRMPGFKHDKDGFNIVETPAQERMAAKERGMEWD